MNAVAHTSRLQRILDACLPVPDDELQDRRQKYVDGLTFRAVVSVVFLIMFAVLDRAVPENRPPLPPLVVALVCLASMNGVYWILGQHSEFSLRLFYLHWIIDLGFISIILFLLGGIDIPYGLLAFMMLIVTSATFLSFHASLIVACLAAVVTVLLAILQTTGLISPPRAWVAVPYPMGTRIIAVTAASVFYFIFAYLAGTLADRLKAANVRLRAAQSEIAEQNRLLEDKVATRTQELSSRNAEIEEFVHIVTHDLKNVSVGAAETARLLLAAAESRLDQKGARYANHLLNDTRRMNSMLVQLLSLFKIDEQAQQKSTVSLKALVDDLIKGFAAKAEARRIEFVVEPMPDVHANALQLRHVVANILDNAIKYSGDKERPRIEVRCVEAVSEWRLEITDNGIGIPSAQQERVFQLYYRGANQRVGGIQQEGEGVGLAISKRMVERWSGKIWVESRVNEGTRVSLTIPRESNVS